MATNMSNLSTTSSLAGSTGVVVWEWSNEFGNWNPYDANVVNFIERAKQNSSQTISLGDADPKLHSYILDIQKMIQIRLQTGMGRPVRRSVYPAASMLGKGIAWQWMGDQGQWHTYDEEVAVILEDCHSLGITFLDLSKTANRLPYYIDFQKMLQTRIETSTGRKIRREILNVRYPLEHTSNNVKSSHSIDSQSGLKRNCVISDQNKRAKKPRTIDHTQSSTSSLKIPNGNGPINYSTSASQNLPSQSFSNSIVSSFSNMLQSNNIGLPHMGSGANTFPFHPGVSIGGMHFPMAGQVVPQAFPSSQSIFGGTGIDSTVSDHLGPLTRRRFAAIVQTQTPQQPPVGAYSAIPGCSYNAGGSTVTSMNSSLSSSLFPKNQNSRITPVISGITNVLVSPTVPQATDQQSAGSSTKPKKTSIPSHGRISNTSSKGKQKVKTADTVLKKYITVIEAPPADEDCCICCDKLNEASGYGAGDDSVVISLQKCSHHFHRLCLYAMYDSGNKDGSIQCPTCKTIYGEKMGNCPPGVMDYQTMSQSLPGHPDCGTIVINYNISHGVQSSEHPNPGKRYTARGFPRGGYLPDNEDGRKVLQLLLIAWRRKLTFTIGSSSTTGESDTVIWNEIHHKTEFGSNFSGHGYPDENYINNVLLELACQGVNEDDL